MLTSGLFYYKTQIAQAKDSTVTKPISPKVISLFERLDSDNDGWLSLTDLQIKKALFINKINLGKGPRDFYQRRRVTLEDLNLLLQPAVQLSHWDTNQDKRLSVEEFASSSYPFKSGLFIILPHLQKLDTDNSAFVSRAELQHFLFQRYPYLAEHDFLTNWLINQLLARYKATENDQIPIQKNTVNSET